MKSKYFFILFSLVFSSCYRDGFLSEQVTPPSPRFPGVHEAIWTHFESFENEAARRGIAINLATANITAMIADINDHNVAGQCSYGYGGPRRITIDKPFWNRANHLRREMIVFHELGHCYLDRGHTEATFESGYCRSIMRSGTCCCRDAYTSQNRDYYLDELFGLLVDN